MGDRKMRCNRCYMKEKKDVQMKTDGHNWVCPVCDYTCLI